MWFMKSLRTSWLAGLCVAAVLPLAAQTHQREDLFQYPAALTQSVSGRANTSRHELLCSRRRSPQSAGNSALSFRTQNSRNVRTASDTAHVEWTSRYSSGQALSSDFGTGIAVDESGNIFVTGYSSHLPYGADIVTIKYDKLGRQQWLQRYRGKTNGDNGGVAVVIGAGGAIYVAGYVVGADGTYDWAVLRYYSNGDLKWSSRYSGPSVSDDQPVAMKLDAEGNIIVTGYGESEFVTIKFDSLGSQRWLARYQGPALGNGAPSALGVDRGGNIYVTGASGGGGYSDFLTVKYSKEGSQLWTARYDGAAHAYDVSDDLCVDTSGNVYVTGTSQESPGSPFHISTIKYSPQGNQEWIKSYTANSYGDIARAIALDDKSNVYIVAHSDSLQAPVGLMLKYSSEGILLWTMRDQAEYQNVVVDRRGSIYTSGWMTKGSTYSALMAKYHPSGIRLWRNTYDMPNNETSYASAMCVDSAGNSYATGGTHPDVPISTDDLATVGWDSTGKVQWTARYEGSGSSSDAPQYLAVDAKGNCFVAATSDSAYGIGLVILKLSRDGTVLWSRRFDTPYGYNWPQSISTDAEGNFYMLATSEEVSSASDFLTIKYDADGNNCWSARYRAQGSGQNYPSALAIDGHGNVIVTGSAYGWEESFITTVKYNRDGAQMWVARIPISSSFNDEPRAIALDAAGNIYITGGIGGECFTVRYSGDGVEEWSSRYKTAPNSSSWGSAIALDGQGNVVVTGPCDLFKADQNTFTIKYNPYGRLLWAARYESPWGLREYVEALAIDPGGNIYVGGYAFDGTSNHLILIKYTTVGRQLWATNYASDVSGGAFLETMMLHDNGYLTLTYSGAPELRSVTFSTSGILKREMKYGLPGPHTLDHSGQLWLAHQVRGNAWRVFDISRYSVTPLQPSNDPPWTPSVPSLAQNYPNPFRGSTIVVFALSQSRRVNLRVFDMLGRTVATLVDGELAAGDHAAEWNASDASSGVYFFRIQTSDFVETRKMVLIK